MGKSAPQMADMPVIALSTTLEEDLPEKEGVLRVPWPCETKVLVQRIEATLAGEPCGCPGRLRQGCSWNGSKPPSCGRPTTSSSSWC